MRDMSGQQEKTQTVVATGEGIKVVTPKPSRKHIHRSSVQILLEEPDDIVREQVGGFFNFLREHAVVGVAIGFIVGLQAQTVIKQLVTSFITPLLNLILGQNLQNDGITVHDGTGHVVFFWGAFLYSLADFLVVLLSIYLVVKVFQLDKFDKK
jgi:large-conductance mechanosensitive channel